MVSFRLSALAMAFVILTASSSQAALVNKPYSPDLYERDALMMEPRQMVKRVEASRPYQPDLFARESLELDEERLEKRSAAPSLSTPAVKATWNLFKRIEESEEQMHARGLIEDSVIEARGWCGSDNQCGDHHYCSTKRHQCYRRIRDGSRCDRDRACGSGYCCEKEKTCKPKRSDGSRCHHNNGACHSGYCSVVSDKCHRQGDRGDKCRVDRGCKGDLSCVNGSCTHSGSSHPSRPHHPQHPAPSGSAEYRRSFSPLA